MDTKEFTSWSLQNHPFVFVRVGNSDNDCSNKPITTFNSVSVPGTTCKRPAGVSGALGIFSNATLVSGK